MANAVSLTSLGPVNERRLRPVYEHLDNANHKGALHEADKVLRKQRDLSAAKVLKTIALHRLGRGDEAYSLSQEIALVGPTDENSLQGLSLYYREIQRPDLIPAIYEVALSKCPGNEEYLTHLFMAYVRTERPKEMQRVAINLYKHHPKNPYLFWGIMSIVMQAESNKQLAKTMFLPLAERMIEKHIIEKGKIEAEAETRLYMMVLDMLGKHDKALKVLGEENSKTFTLDTDGLYDLKAELHKKMEKWEKVNSDSKKFFEKDPDIWNHVLSYLDSLEHLIEKNWKPEESQEAGTSSEDPDSSWDQAVDFFLEVRKKELEDDSKRYRRGPFLAVLELRKRVQAASEKDPSLASALGKIGSVVDLVIEYSRMFASKPCCFTDVETFAKFFSQDQKTELLKKITEEVDKFVSSESENNVDNDDDMKKEKKIWKHLFLLKMQRYLGYHESMERDEKLKVIEELLQRHSDGLKCSMYRKETDVRAADDYCLMAVNLLIDLWANEGDPEDLWRAIFTLEIAKQSSPVNPQFKIVLIRLYSAVGIFLPCAQIYDSLDIKHVQQDALGHIISNSVSSLGHYQLASQAYEASRAFFISNEKDSVEFLISCFRNGTFHKVSEFISFRDQVKNSLHAASTINEHTYMDFVTQADIDVPYYDLILSSCLPKMMSDLDKLTDNRDFRLQFDWVPEDRQLTESQIETSFSLEKKWLRFREVQIRTVIALLGQMTSPQTMLEQNNFVEISLLLKELETVIEDTKQDKNLDVKFPFHGPPQPRIQSSLDFGYQDQTLKLLRLLKKILKESSNPGTEKDLKEMSESFISGIQAALSSTDLVNTNRDSTVGSDGKRKAAKRDKKDDLSCVTTSPEKSTTFALKLPVPDVLKKLNRIILERLVATCELYSLCVLLVYNLRSRIRPESIKRRKKKKGSQSTAGSGVADFYQKFIKDLQQVGEKIKSAVLELRSNAEVMTLDLSKVKIESKENLSNGDLKPMQDGGEGDTPIEHPHGDSTSSEAKATNEDTPASKDTPLQDQLVKVASTSLLNATRQILNVVQGRLGNLKEIKV